MKFATATVFLSCLMIGAFAETHEHELDHVDHVGPHPMNETSSEEDIHHLDDPHTTQLSSHIEVHDDHDDMQVDVSHDSNMSNHTDVHDNDHHHDDVVEITVESATKEEAFHLDDEQDDEHPVTHIDNTRGLTHECIYIKNKKNDEYANFFRTRTLVKEIELEDI